MVDFMEDYLHALRYLSDPAHHDEAVELIAEATKQKPALYAGLGVHQARLLPRSPRRCPISSALQANVESAAQARLSAQTASTVKKYADLSLAKEAARRLGN